MPEVVWYVVALQETHHQHHVYTRLKLGLKVIDHYLKLLQHLATELAQRLKSCVYVCVCVRACMYACVCVCVYKLCVRVCVI